MTYAKRLGGASIVFGVALVAGLSMPSLVSADNATDVLSRIDLLEQQTMDLSRSVQALGFTNEPLFPPASVGEGQLVAQSRDIASVNVRLDEIESQLRSLTGQVEGVQFQVTQIYQQLERMQQDNDFRFGELESALGKTDAVTQPGSETLAGELPQSQTVSEPTPETSQVDDRQPLSVGAVETPPIGADSADPLLSGGAPVLGQIPADDAVVTQGTGSETAIEPDGEISSVFSSGVSLDLPTADGGIDFSGSSITGPGQALDLNYDPGQLVTEADAEAQYRAGFDAVVQGDYDFAIAQFRQFLGLFPQHSLAPDASNWLGEALLQKGLYADAAEVFFVGFKDHETSLRAPDLLLKLGISLNGAGEREAACRTFVEVSRRYPEMGGAFAQRVASEMAQAQC